MPGTLLFEYAVLRIVPRVEREEFFNVGVVMYCRDAKFLQVKYDLNEQKLRAFCEVTEIDKLKEYLTSFENICNAAPDAGPIAKLDAASRFRWLTATRSTVLQPSKVHPGLTDNVESTLQKLFERLVL